MSKQEVDIILNKMISRKLLVFLIACAGLFLGNIPSKDWIIIATAYIGVQGFTDIINKFKE